MDSSAIEIKDDRLVLSEWIVDDTYHLVVTEDIFGKPWNDPNNNQKAQSE